MTTATGVSPKVSAFEVLTSMVVYTLVYAVLAVIEVKLFLTYVKRGADPSSSRPPRTRRTDETLRSSLPTEGTQRITDMTLNEFWFLIIGVLWAGFLVLEGFDFGVGALLPTWARVATRAVPTSAAGSMLTTIGPHWDGNEVWLLTAGGATFAAFPHWYATMFSAMYLRSCSSSSRSSCAPWA